MSRVNVISELAFLENFRANRTEQYRWAEWLKTHFDASVWQGVFPGYSSITIDFNVHLDDGSYLTSAKNVPLLETFKCWLCVQTHFDANSGCVLSPSTAYQRVTRTLHLIDYFLLKADEFQLATHGLELITENDLVGLLRALAGSSEITEGIYQWPILLERFLREQISNLNDEVVLKAIAAQPSLSTGIPDLDDRLLGLDEAEIVKARCWLWTNGFYKSTAEKKDYRHIPNTRILAEKIYSNTLWGRYRKPIPSELLVEPMERYVREYRSIPMRNSNTERMGVKIFAFYKSLLKTLGLLGEIALPVPLPALQVLDDKMLRQVLELQSLGRVRTPPQSVVLPALRNAIEFALEYGNDIIDSVLAVYSRSSKAGATCAAYCRSHGISHCLTPKLQKAGVRTWSLTQEMSFHKCNPNQEFSIRAPKVEFFARLRANEGLHQLLLVLYGAVEVCVGILMARRQGELLDLVAYKCLDKSQSNLMFYARKTGEVGFRELIARPIPQIAVRFIQLLERFQTGLLDLGVIPHYTFLFRYPTPEVNRLVALYPSDYNRCLDIFCDYFETPVNQQGERYYLRQHPMRRFFAMLFFWGGSFGGMETLRWFLGHADLEHLYHYITESTPGDVLTSLKASYAAEQLKLSDPQAKPLEDLVEHHFGTRVFSVLDADELDEYIEDLIHQGQVAIEPEFFVGPNGNSYRILIKISPRGGQYE